MIELKDILFVGNLISYNLQLLYLIELAIQTCVILLISAIFICLQTKVSLH